MSCCSSDGHCSTDQTAGEQVGGITTVYSVTGMTCGHCEQSVSSAISALDGVTRVKVDVKTGLVTVTSDAEPDDAIVREAVDEAGYEVAGRAAANVH
ncbi:copper chaperone CopZ [Streptomyces phaeochromogenes]|uniref:heavy-metal-associated domain-containing protein n=1 Tax=Streptomyces phaeochromogenes TaxID=1923 RepID=UPI00278F83E6|nr:heavy metal-associated domain-containing protein [Streptomyces phaeochromogenes]MDQ0948571.1 copper chaperone CopZ [Streptomyces phaeochromogenes]